MSKRFCLIPISCRISFGSVNQLNPYGLLLEYHRDSFFYSWVVFDAYSPYASGSARNGMMILGLKDRNLGVNVSDRKNAIQAAQFLKTKNPRLPLTDIEEKKVSLTEIHDEK